MQAEKMIRVLRQVEWGWRGEGCPWCGWGRSEGHHGKCGLAAMLGGELRALLPEAYQEPVVKIWILGPLEGLRAWLVGRAFNFAAWLAGYDVELEIGEETGSE